MTPTHNVPGEPKGIVSLILHAHLPFIRHRPGERELETQWLFEAITETYLPLLDVFDNLVAERVPFRIVLGVTPPLCAMLADPYLQSRYVDHLARRIELAEREVDRTRREAPEHHESALFYREMFTRSRQRFAEHYQGDLVGAFRRLQDAGALELIASAATHGYLPLMQNVPDAATAQIRLGVEDYVERFGRTPVGFWLPECGFTPGDDRALAESGVRYTILDTHGVLHARPRPRDASFAPILTPAGVAIVARDEESSKQVWSADEGYPGDSDYREFYRDIGYDLPWDQLEAYLETGFRHHTGIKYHRITGRDVPKEPYNLRAALDKAAVHAGNFVFNRERQIEYVASRMQRPPLIAAPYDAELFGHWWFEGPRFLDFLIRKAAFDQRTFRLATPADYLRAYGAGDTALPSASSWGYRGYNEVWLEGSNAWLYRHLLEAARRMRDLALRHPQAVDLERRALNQAARELCLAQSSDWAFIMKTGTVVEYAVYRTKLHLGRFFELAEAIEDGILDPLTVTRYEVEDGILPACDYTVYARPLPAPENAREAAVAVTR